MNKNVIREIKETTTVKEIVELLKFVESREITRVPKLCIFSDLSGNIQGCDGTPLFNLEKLDKYVSESEEVKEEFIFNDGQISGTEEEIKEMFRCIGYRINDKEITMLKEAGYIDRNPVEEAKEKYNEWRYKSDPSGYGEVITDLYRAIEYLEDKLNDK